MPPLWLFSTRAMPYIFFCFGHFIKPLDILCSRGQIRSDWIDQWFFYRSTRLVPWFCFSVDVLPSILFDDH
jgi:hypothetical protein